MNGESKATLFALPLILCSLLVAITSGNNRMRTSDRRKDSHKGQESNLQPFSIPASSSPAANDPPTDFRDGCTSWWKGLLGGSCVVLALGFLMIAVWQSRAASLAIQKAADATQSTTQAIARQLELSQRPWVSINAIIASPLTYDSEGAAEVTLKLAIRNVGSTPAKGLSVEPKMFIASLGEQDPVMVRSRVCEENRTRGAGKDGTLFPTAELAKLVTFHTDAKEILRESNRTGSFSPAFVICASYRSTFDDRSRYTTGTIYYLRRIDPARPGMFVRMTNGMEIPRDLLALNYDPIGETVAN
jgi:hypothetical protein